MKALALVSDAFGGHGGIALYNRNVLTALCHYGGGSSVVALPRLVPYEVGPLPPGLDFDLLARRGKIAFCGSAARALLRHRRFDLVVASHVNLLPVAEIARRVGRARLMLFVYGIDAWSRRHQLTETLLRHVDVIVSIRQHTIDRLRTWAPLDGIATHVLENAIDLTRYGAGDKDAALVERYGLRDRRVLMTLGRIEDPNFGFDEVIEALPLVVREVPNVVYLAVGSGHEIPRLRQKAQRLDVADRVVFTGPVTESEKVSYYRLADAFAMPGSHPTDFDRYPLRFVFLEAMACGLPVVASRPEELVDERNSPIPNIYVDPRDPGDLSRGLVHALRTGPGAVPDALRRYDYPSFERRLHDILDQLPSRH